MDPRDRTLDELVEQFMANPGSVESEKLEFKAKEKVDTTEGRRDLAKKASAIANTSGGTIVIGVGEGDRGDIIQSFSSRSEIKRDLASVFHDNTKPNLDQLVDISVSKLSTGPRLLRIDIQRAESVPVEFYERDQDTFVAYHRVEDTTREMATNDVVEFTKKRTRAAPDTRSELEKVITVDTSEIRIFDDSPPRRSPEHRAILNIDKHGLIVPAEAYRSNSHKKSLTFHLEKRVEGTGLDALKRVLDEVETELGADLGHNFGYGIKYGSKELIGRDSANYISDINNLKDTLRLLGWEDSNDPRPVAIGGTRCEFGFIWIQAQYHTGSLTRIKCGLIMDDIPLNTGPLNRVFGNEWIRQDNSLRSIQLRLHGEEIPLANSRAVLFDSSSSLARTDIVADNPYFQNEKAVLGATDQEIPKSFIETICAVDRLSFDVRAGHSSDDIYHSVAELRMSYVHAVIPVYFVWAMCDPHEEPPSDNPPTLDWLDSVAYDEDEGESSE